MSSAITNFIPHPRIHEVDRVAVASEPPETWSVVRGTDLYDLRFVRALFNLRAVPERAAARLRGEHLEPFPESAPLDQIVGPGSGFHLLAEVPGEEFVAGAIGKVWEPTIPFVPITPATFAAFRDPGYAKVAWSLQVYPRAGGGSWIGLDLRVDATDEDAWHEFTPYWRLIGRFSRVMRKSLLRSMVKKLGCACSDKGRLLPGDDILSGARVTNTMAITIESPVDNVWPWLVQMGCRRAGWYSLDRLDNGGVPSAERIIPELQHIAVGDILPATPLGEEGFAVLRVNPRRALVLGAPQLLRGRHATDKRWGMFGADYDVTWAFVLEPIGDEAARLIVRVRADFVPNLRMELTRPAILAIHNVMEHAQLKNLKRRAEALVH